MAALMVDSLADYSVERMDAMMVHLLAETLVDEKVETRVAVTVEKTVGRLADN